MRPAGGRIELLRRVDWDAVATWVLGFGLIALLGIEGGGFDVLVFSQIGIALWWILLLGVLVRALPREALGATALLALALLAAFVVWTGLSLAWTESVGRTATDLARVLTYLGVFALVLFARASREGQRLIGAVAAAIVLLAALGLLSRFHPAWFPSADQTGQLLVDSRERLSYPLNYWNGLGALVAIGMPLLVHLSASARALALRALAAAALPALMLTAFYTLSRGGIAAGAIALALLLALTSDRIPKLITLLVAGAGAVVLVGLADRRDALREGLTDAVARHQGDQMLLLTLLVCAAVGLVQLGIALGFAERRRPRWTRPTRNQSLALLGVAAVAAIAVAAAAGAPGRAADAFDEFKGGGNAGAGTSRLGSFAGESRYALWESAFAEFEDKPLAGTGSGTFVYWWNRDANGAESVEDAHSLYMQTLGELGAVGLLLLAGFLLVVFASGLRRGLRAGPGERARIAAAIAACAAFCLSAGVDWSWQLPVLPATMLLLGSTLVAGGPAAPWAARLGGWPARGAFAAGALAAIVLIAIPFAGTDLLRQSEAEARGGDLEAALEDARSAQNVQPGAAAPRLQEALVLELEGELDAAATAARAATERESTNWQNWLVLSRIEAKRGHPAAAVAAYRRARSLKPLSPLFEREATG